MPMGQRGTGPQAATRNLMSSGSVPSPATTIEEQNRAFKRMNMRLSELHWFLTGPVSPQFNVAQPWIKGYNGEVAISINGQYSTVLTRVWVDQDLKREMGF